jgi:hypothetical protein
MIFTAGVITALSNWEKGSLLFRNLHGKFQQTSGAQYSLRVRAAGYPFAAFDGIRVLGAGGLPTG